MTMTLGELADLGEPERYEIYTRDLPVSRRDECQETINASQFVCTRWFDHFGDHAHVSPSGLVLEVWENLAPEDAGMDDEDECEECRADDDLRVVKASPHSVHTLSPAIREVYSQLDEIGEEVVEAIAFAKDKLRLLHKTASDLSDNEGLLEEFEYTRTALDKLESDAMDLGVPEEDWT